MNYKIFDVNEENGKITISSKNWGIGVLKYRDKYIMVKQTRYGAGEELWEFPCGNIEPTDKNALAGIIRELEEETGYNVSDHIKTIKKLYEHNPNPAFMTNKMTAYFIEIDELEEIGQNLDENEDINVFLAEDDFVRSTMEETNTSVMMRLAFELTKGV